MAASHKTRAKARHLYEVEGESLSQIAKTIGMSPVTVGKWKKNEGWERQDVTYDVVATPTPEPAPVAATVNPPIIADDLYDTMAPEPSDDEAELRAKIAELEAENKALAEKNQELSPSRNIQGMLDDRVKWLTENSPEGERYWLNRAEAKFKADNMERAKQGLPVFDINQHPEILDDLINELKTKEAMGKVGEPDEPASRKVKLFIMRNGMPTIEQIPLENQVNNMKGSLADGIVRYTRKGFKLTEPFLCPRAGCFQPAESNANGSWLHDGYCSERHRAEVEGNSPSGMVGMTTRDVVRSG